MIKLRNRWVGLVFISMAISLVVIDSTIVNTIFPNIIQSLAIRSSEVQWVQESYVLVLASMLLVWGSLADRFGRRLILLFGLGIFVAASFRAGFADDATTLIIARVIQGVGGAMILPSTLSLVNANFQGKDRGIAFAIWGSTIGAMVAIGPVIGGWLATNLSWSWVFLVNIPIGLFIILGLLVFVVESKAENTAKGIDFIGAFFSMVLFGFLVFALIEGRLYGWLFVNPLHREFQIGDFKWAKEGISIIPIALLVALIALAAFVLYERRRTQAGKPVILDLDLFKISSFRNGSLAALIVSLGEFGLVFAIPLWLQGVLALDAISAGIVLLWLAGGALLASVLGGVLSNRFLPVQSVRLGLALEAIGVLGIAIFSSNPVGSAQYWSEKSMTFGGALPASVIGDGIGFNDPRVLEVEMPGINGVMSASAMAKIYSAAVTNTDGIRLLTDYTILKAINPGSFGQSVWGEPAPWATRGLGFMVHVPGSREYTSNQSFGHDGIGSQAAFGDLANKIGFGYTTSYLYPVAPYEMKNQHELIHALQKVLA